MPLSADKLRDAFRSFDADGSGSVSYGELFSATRLSATKAGAEAAQTAAGHSGVPLCVFEGEPFFGQDRLALLQWRLEQLGVPRR